MIMTNAVTTIEPIIVLLSITIFKREIAVN